MRHKNLSPISHFFQLLLTLAALVVSASGQCCLGFSGGVCVSCPSGMHLYRGNCIFDLAGCVTYVSGFDCSGCRSNYQLVNGSCVHQRFPPAVANGTNFTVYLDSTLKPDPQMAAAHHALENSTELWLEWYNYTLQLSRTFLNSRALARQAANLMSTATGSSKIHYIFTGSLARANDTLLLYRFIYELSSGGGFADCLVVVEMANGVQNYIQLNEVKISKVVGESAWTELRWKGPEEAYILGKLSNIFPKIMGYGYLKGYCKDVEEGVNCTMFFMSNHQGVISFVYLAEKGEIPQSTPNTTNSTSTQNSNVTNNTGNPANQQQNASNSTNTNVPPKDTSNNKTQSSQTNQQQALPSKNTALVQNMLNISNLNSNPIFNAGFAVIVQQYGLSPSCSIFQLFSITASPIIYGFYLEDRQASMYYRFAFTVDLTNGIFQILNYTQSSQPLIVVTAPSNNTTPSNSSKHNNSSSSKKNNSSNARADALKNNTSSPVANASSNSSVSQLCGKTGPQLVDITNRQTSDIFLPKINLILRTMYESMLANTRISSAKYSLTLDPASSSSNITYQISYLNMEGIAFNFVVAIINNEFQLVSAPNSTASNEPQPTANNAAQPKTENKNEAKNVTGKDSQSINNTKQHQNATQSKVQSQKSNQTPKNDTESKITADSTPNQNAKPNEINQTNKNTTNASQIAANDSDAKSANNSTPTTTNPTNTSAQSAANSSNPRVAANESQMVRPIQIPAKNYTTEPRYKSLISILRSIYRIPMNASVLSMQLWNQTGTDNRYEIVFRMNYARQLPDATIAKVSTYRLSVNPSSFVSVQSEKIQFVKAEPTNRTDSSSNQTKAEPEKPLPTQNTSNSTQNHLPPPLQKNPPLASPSLALLGTAPSPYLRNLYQMLTLHSPSLASFTLQSLSSSANNTSGALASYSEKLQFSKQDQRMCFSVSYQAVSLKNGPQGTKSQVLINLLEYYVINCSSPIHSNFAATPFANQSVQNAAVNAQISVIARNRPFTFSLYQQWQSFYRVRFSSVLFGEREVLIDSASTLVLSYVAASQPIYSPKMGNSIVASSVVDALRSNMEKIFKLSPKTLSIEWIGSSNDDDVLLLQILATTQTQAQWAQPIYQHFAVRAVFWSAQNFIKIVGASALDLFSSHYTLNLAITEKWRQVLATETFADPAFAPVLPSLLAAYTGFLQNSQLIAIYREQAGDRSLKEYLSAGKGARLLVAISKKFSDSYQTGYLLTINYNSALSQSHIQNIETLHLSNNVAINGCSQMQQISTLPQCQTCRQGYRLSNGFCLSKIEGCLEYAQQLCIRCADGFLLSKDLQRCVSQSDQQSFSSAVIRAYRAEAAH